MNKRKKFRERYIYVSNFTKTRHLTKLVTLLKKKKKIASDFLSNIKDEYLFFSISFIKDNHIQILICHVVDV